MKLQELRTREPIEWPGVGSGNTNHMKAGNFTLELEQGIVTVTSQHGVVRMVPLGNVAYMSPAPKEAKK